MNQVATNKTNTVVLVAGDVAAMSYTQRLHCCRQLAGLMEVRLEWPAPPPGPAFPDSLFLCDEGLKKAIENCDDIHTLFALYAENRYRLERQPLLEQLFADRRRELEMDSNTDSEHLG